MTTELLPGLAIDSSGQVTVSEQMGELLFDLALELEDSFRNPVDVEHILAAIVLATRAGEIDAATQLSPPSPHIRDVLRHHLRKVFAQYGNQLGSD